MKKTILIAAITGMLCITGIDAQDKKPVVPPTTPPASTTQPPATPPVAKPGPKAYKEFITDKAKTMPGIFTVHKIDDKYYFEIGDSLMGRVWLAQTRIIKTPTVSGLYGGEQMNVQTLRWEKGPDNKLFLRGVSYINMANDSLPISMAVKASNTEPIIAAFDVKAFSKDSAGMIIEVTDFFKGENPAFTFSASLKRGLGLTALAPDRSFINSIKTYPINTEVRTTKTYNTTGIVSGVNPIGIPITDMPTANIGGVVTFEMNVSMIMLPKEPMQRRFYDKRVGFYQLSYNNYGLDEQRTTAENYISRWRLEPRPEDIPKMKRGELVEPIKPIVYYIDPATPVKWRKYLKLGVEDWQKAFEQAGFKNAILAKDWPENDSTMSLEDARYSVIRYFASDIDNAYGPKTVDPRSGEIIESDVGWYHNIMSILRDWYLMQAGATDPRAQKGKFDDELMGDLIRFVSSHEIGHTLGMPHNFGSSSTVPVEKLRDKKWVEEHGHTPSLMDYARFNYVAQPEDNISPKGLYARIGDYDKWAVEWAYKPIFDKTEDETKAITRNWAKTRTEANPRLLYLAQRGSLLYSDPRAQNEDLGDDPIKASGYGIKNLKRILPNLMKWSYRDGEYFDDLDAMFAALKGQLGYYFIHVTNLVGGIYQDRKTYDQEGDFIRPVPKATQKDAVNFLNQNIFETPTWLIDWKQLKKFNQDQVVEEIRSFQESRLNYLVNPNRMARMIESMAMLGSNNAYTPDDMLADIKKGMWSELYAKKPIDLFRRNLQKVYVERLIVLLNGGGNAYTPTPGPNQPTRRNTSDFGITQVDPKKDDIISIIKGNLRSLKADIQSALPSMSDKLTKYHLIDVSERIEEALKPK